MKTRAVMITGKLAKRDSIDIADNKGLNMLFLHAQKRLFIYFLLTIFAAFMLANEASADTRNEKVLSGAATATWIAEGKGSGIVYIFFDPNCPSCQFLYRNLRAFVKTNQYQFRWIPVAIVNATSLGKAAAILEAQDPLTAFRQNEERYKAYAGGLDEHIPSEKTERILAANESLLNGLNIPVIPSMLFAGKNNEAILIQGALSPLALRKVFARLP